MSLVLNLCAHNLHTSRHRVDVLFPPKHAPLRLLSGVLVPSLPKKLPSVPSSTLPSPAADLSPQHAPFPACSAAGYTQTGPVAPSSFPDAPSLASRGPGRTGAVGGGEAAPSGAELRRPPPRDPGTAAGQGSPPPPPPRSLPSPAPRRGRLRYILCKELVQRRFQSQPRQRMNKAEWRGEGDDSSVYARCNIFLRKELHITRAGAFSPTAGRAAIYPRSPHAPRHPSAGSCSALFMHQLAGTICGSLPSCPTARTGP
ncbi:uncharacterized protein ACIBXB_019771 [Morphnus guianensis]